QPASLIEKPVRPKKVTMAAGTIFLAMLLSIGVPTLIETIKRKTLADETAFADRFRLPVSARVPRVASLRLGRHERERVADECGRILQQLRSTNTGDRLGSVGLLSCDENCSTSGLASQLAITAGTKYGLSTLLIDGDRKLRTVSKLFRLNGAPGFGELATSTDIAINDCVQSSKFDNVMLMTPQAKTSRLARLVHPRDVASLLHKFTEEYDLVIIDLPRDEAFSRSFCQMIDNVFIVADLDKTTPESVTESLDGLRGSNVRVKGLVLQGNKSGR
ncbi:MAG: hypothetical protein KDB27_34505, partial [Planctomycetales bacterium]|nr:hypothetical protein [Planctomycetales bacterium]